MREILWYSLILEFYTLRFIEYILVHFFINFLVGFPAIAIWVLRAGILPPGTGPKGAATGFDQEPQRPTAKT
jgi:hypothetical protein